VRRATAVIVESVFYPNALGPNAPTFEDIFDALGDLGYVYRGSLRVGWYRGAPMLADVLFLRRSAADAWRRDSLPTDDTNAYSLPSDAVCPDGHAPLRCGSDAVGATDGIGGLARPAEVTLVDEVSAFSSCVSFRTHAGFLHRFIKCSSLADISTPTTTPTTTPGRSSGHTASISPFNWSIDGLAVLPARVRPRWIRPPTVWLSSQLSHVRFSYGEVTETLCAIGFTDVHAIPHGNTRSQSTTPYSNYPWPYQILRALQATLT